MFRLRLAVAPASTVQVASGSITHRLAGRPTSIGPALRVGQPGDRRRPPRHAGEHLGQGQLEHGQGDAERPLQPEHPGRSQVEGLVLRVRGVGGVVGGDHVEHRVDHPGPHRGHVLVGAQRRVDLEHRVERRALGVGEQHVVRRRLGRDGEARAPGPRRSGPPTPPSTCAACGSERRSCGPGRCRARPSPPRRRGAGRRCPGGPTTPPRACGRRRPATRSRSAGPAPPSCGSPTAYSIARRISRSSCTPVPSSVKSRTPRSAISAIGASRSPARSTVIAPDGCTAHSASRARSCTSRTTAALSMAGVVLGIATTAVNPPRAAQRLPDSIVSASSLPGWRRWACRSTSPGATTHPPASSTTSPERSSPTPTTTPSRDHHVGPARPRCVDDRPALQHRRRRRRPATHHGPPIPRGHPRRPSGRPDLPTSPDGRHAADASATARAARARLVGHPVEPTPARPGQQPEQHRHAHRDPVAHLVDDHGPGVVGHLGRDLHPPVHRARVHEHHVGAQPPGPVVGEPVAGRVLAQRRHQGLGHPLPLHAQEVHHVGAWPAPRRGRGDTSTGSPTSDGGSRVGGATSVTVAPRVVKAWRSARATRECFTSPTMAIRHPSSDPRCLAQRVAVEQGLGGVVVPAVAAVDHRRRRSTTPPGAAPPTTSAAPPRRRSPWPRG